MLTGFGVDGDLRTTSVVDLVDRACRAPHAPGRQGCRDICQFQRVDLKGAEGERPDVLPLDEVGQAFVAVRLVTAGGARLRVGTKAKAHRHIHGAGDADLRDEFGERGIGRLGQCLGDTHAQVTRVAVVLHAPGLTGTTLGATLAQALGVETSWHVESGVDAQAEIQRGRRGENLEDGARAITDQRERLGLDGLPGIGIESVGPVARHRDQRMARLSGQYHVHHAGDPVQIRRRDRVHRLLDLRLYVGVQGGLDQVSAPGDLFLAQSRSGQELLNVVAEEGAIPGRDAPAGQLVGACQDAQWLLFGGA